MDSAIRDAIAAMIELNANLLIIFAIVTFVKKDLNSEKSNDFLIVLNYIMNKLYQPIYAIAGTSATLQSRAPLIFLAILIPIEIICMATLRQ